MVTNNTFLAPLVPIQRATPAYRLAEFNRNSFSIYTKFSPYYQADYGTRGPKQPFIYTKLTDPESVKNRMANESQAIPTESTLVDVSRITKFLQTGTGQFFIAKQYLLQNTNAFNETRIYNPGSILGATAKAGSFGLIDRPNRHLRTNGGIVDFFLDSTLSSIGFETKDFSKDHIDGTAGSADNSALPTYTRNSRNELSGAEAGLVRLQTAKQSLDRFNTIWAGTTSRSGGLLRAIGAALNKVVSMIPSTNPMGILGGSARYAWQYRPEYLNGESGIYYKFLNNSDLLSYKRIGANGSWSALKYKFYNDPDLNSYDEINLPRQNFHFYYPQEVTTVPRRDNGESWYAHPGRNAVRLVNQDPNLGLIKKYNEMFNTDDLDKSSYDDGVIYARKSMERYRNVKYRPLVGPETEFNNYYMIPDDGKSAKPYSNELENDSNIITINKRGFSKVAKFNSDGILETSGKDEYNAYYPIPERQQNKLSISENQSKDLIYFYFYDIVNKMFIPFRATLSGINEQNVADWEDIKYMGRADSLFVYKGFTREMGFTFKVYANSIEELVPMWERVNYLVGLTRPSKYTSTEPPTTNNTSTEPSTTNNVIPRTNQTTDSGESLFSDSFLSDIAGRIGENLAISIEENLVSGLAGAARLVEIGGSADGKVQETSNEILSNVIGKPSDETVAMTPYVVSENRPRQPTLMAPYIVGAGSQFIYPPMIKFRIGDLYVDQPAVLSSVSVTIPDEAVWESFRGNSYKYLYGNGKNIEIPNGKSRQLPTQVDISVQLRLLEKVRSLTTNPQYGNIKFEGGKIKERWAL